MVEVLRYSPSITPQDGPHTLSPALGAPFSAARAMTREEHMRKEMGLRKCGLRRGPPKRSQTVADYSILPDPTMPLPSSSLSSVSSSARVAPAREVPRTMPPMAQIQESEVVANTEPSVPNVVAACEQKKVPLRPGMGAPRRSYSVMDFEPIPPSEQPSSGITFTDLPTELHYAIFDHLDPIDSTCLGLASRHFYAVHKHFHGMKIALNTRRSGPNDAEWAWRLAGQLANPSTHPEHAKQAMIGLASFRVRGAVYCRKCGAAKCELHRHINEWVGEGYEYCSVKDKFTEPARAGARHLCYRRKPNDPHQCGRHRQSINRTLTV